MTDPLTPGARKWRDKAEDLQMLADPDTRRFLDQVKGQLLIVLLKRLGGDVTLPITEVDDTGRDMLALQVVDGAIRLVIQRKP